MRGQFPGKLEYSLNFQPSKIIDCNYGGSIYYTISYTAATVYQAIQKRL
jgi:hypothetical protein